MSAGVGSLGRPRPADRSRRAAGTLNRQAVDMVASALSFELPARSFDPLAAR